MRKIYNPFLFRLQIWRINIALSFHFPFERLFEFSFGKDDRYLDKVFCAGFSFFGFSIYISMQDWKYYQFLDNHTPTEESDDVL